MTTSNFILSIDWEDFGQLCCRDHCGVVTAPLDAISRQTSIVLDMLDKHEVKATFFVLGMLANYRPDLVMRIADEGHEIALHGMNHIPLTQMGRNDVKVDLEESLDMIQQVIGKKVFGYRAPCFSVNKSNFYVLEILSELELEYDSSIFPVKMPRYGIEGFETKATVYELPNKKSIVEIPLTVAECLGKKIPVSGGGYMRLYPLWVLKRIYRHLAEVSGLDPIIYMHPYEFDTKTLDCRTNYPDENSTYSRPKSIVFNMKWNLFRQSIRMKIETLLSEYTFITCKEKADLVRNAQNSPTIL